MLGWVTFEVMKHTSGTPMRCIPYCHQQFSSRVRERRSGSLLKLFLNRGPVEVEIEFSLHGGWRNIWRVGWKTSKDLLKGEYRNCGFCLSRIFRPSVRPSVRPCKVFDHTNHIFSELDQVHLACRTLEWTL